MITDIHLENFRSYSDELFEFGPGVNIIVGPNASGKTNMLEALSVACSGKSFRSRDSDLLRFGSDTSRIELHTKTDDHRIVFIVFDSEKISKEFKINDQDLKFLKSLRIKIEEEKQ